MDRTQVLKLSDEKHVYYNIDRYNNTEGVISSRYAQNRSAPILNRPSEYKMAVVRFQFNTLSIPILHYNDNWYITLTYNGNNYTEQLEYIAEEQQPKEGQPIFHYLTILRMINKAFEDAYTALNTAHPGEAPEAPKMFFNDNNKQFYIVYPTTGYDLGLATDNVQVFMNYELYKLFDNFPDFWLYNGSNFDANRKDVRLLVLNNADNLLVMANNPASSLPGAEYNDAVLEQASYYVMSQSFSTLNQWSPYNKIIVVANSVTCRNEWLTNYNQDGQEIAFPILTDFSIDFPPNDSARNIYTFNPSGEYRYIDILGDTPLYNVDTTIFYQNSYTGELRELKLLPRTGYDIKILFEKVK